MSCYYGNSNVLERLMQSALLFAKQSRILESAVIIISTAPIWLGFVSCGLLGFLPKAQPCICVLSQLWLGTVRWFSLQRS